MAEKNGGVHLQTDDEENKDEYGVLLYYKYAEIPHLQDLFEFYHSNCTSLSLLGRVRLSPHGVNVTVGGRLSALKKHIDDLVKSNALFDQTDFKLASCSQPVNDQVAKECGFTSLSIRIVKVVRNLVLLDIYLANLMTIDNGLDLRRALSHVHLYYFSTDLIDDYPNNPSFPILLGFYTLNLDIPSIVLLKLDTLKCEFILSTVMQRHFWK